MDTSEMASVDVGSGSEFNMSEILSGEDLINALRKLHGGRKKVKDGLTTVGLVGYLFS